MSLIRDGVAIPPDLPLFEPSTIAEVLGIEHVRLLSWNSRYGLFGGSELDRGTRYKLTMFQVAAAALAATLVRHGLDAPDVVPIVKRADHALQSIIEQGRYRQTILCVYRSRGYDSLEARHLDRDYKIEAALSAKAVTLVDLEEVVSDVMSALNVEELKR